MGERNRHGPAAHGGRLPAVPFPKRILLALGLLLPGAAVILLARSTGGTARLGFGDLGWITTPVVRAGTMLGALSMLCGLLVLGARARGRTLLFALGSASVVLAALIAAAAGASLDLVGLLAQSLRLSTPIVLGALAGILCERSGVINIAIEGMMLAGACLGYVVAAYTGSLGLGVAAAILAGALMAAFHAALAIYQRTDQIISGTVINILAIGTTGFIRRSILLQTTLRGPPLLPYLPIPLLRRIPILGPVLFNNQPIVYAALILLVVVHVGLFHTPWGLRTRACGEHPRAADTVGIDVLRLRTVNVLLGGMVAGLAGAWFSLETTGTFDDLMTNGKGFIALAAMIFGKWNPLGALLGALLFGFADATQIKLQVLGIGVPYQFLGMLPYVVTMIVLAGVVGRAVPPAADGQPYPPSE
jgi:simple sugar transport system permease protein